ncbi:MAG: hypothetical protein ACK41C_07390 [Phenylobacterium sp.]|uniref:hypothetical protein n=1 Tax=Phenylobacterium sp. TaxID=1871053 RepID=UPI00391C2E54
MPPDRQTPRGDPPPVGDPAVEMDDLRAAYERGRRDAERGRKRHPVLMTLLVVAALAAGLFVVLAAREGSFAGGGARVDEGVTAAAVQAGPAVRDAAAEAEANLREARRAIGRPEEADPAPPPAN